MPRQVNLPFGYRLLSALGTRLRRLGLPIAEFDEQALCRAAMRRTGLSDMGDPYYRQGLQRVLLSAEEGAGLHFLGRYVLHWWIGLHLANRLRMVEAHKRRPSAPLVPPLIVTGLPRSGTTFLHRLLVTDPACRGVPLWELMRPTPPLDGRPDRRRQAAHFELGLRGSSTTSVDDKHYIRADLPEECMWMLSLTFISSSFWIMGPLYRYATWLYEQNLAAYKYREYRWLLEILQSADPARRLALKAPDHTPYVDALLAAVPEALVVQTHRDPVTAMASFNSLIHAVHIDTTATLDVLRMARTNLDLVAHQAARNVEARRGLGERVYDLAYRDLVAEPIAAVRRIYAHFDLPWPNGHEVRLEAYMQRNPQHKYGRHRYRVGDFGLTEEKIAARFAAYRQRWGPLLDA